MWRLRRTALADLFRIRFNAAVERTAVFLIAGGLVIRERRHGHAVVASGLFTRVGGTGSALAALLAGVVVWIVGAGCPIPTSRRCRPP